MQAFLHHMHAVQADGSLAESTGFEFRPNASQHGCTFAVEPQSGFTISVRPLPCPSSANDPERNHNTVVTLDVIWQKTRA